MAWSTSVTIKGLDDFKLGIAKLQDQNYRRAIRRGLNETLEIIQVKEKEEAQAVFDRPTPYTINAFKIKYASTENLEGKVYFADPEGLSQSQHYLYPNVYGVKRGFKRFEAALYAKGIMPKDYYAVPGKGANLDQYGNITAGEIVRILSWFEAFGVAGFRSNMTNENRERMKKGTRDSFGFGYLAIRKRKGRLLPGIYKQVFLPDKTELYSILIFVPKSSTGYSRTLDFYDVAEKQINLNFKNLFGAALNDLINESF